MSNVSAIAPHLKTLDAPAPLRRLPGWLLWRYEQHQGEAKARKVPYYADGGRRYGVQGSQTDRAKLTSFADARDAAARRGMDGVGLALLPDFGLTALDFDNCVDASGRLPADIERIASRSYAEYSPSGNGVRVFLTGNLGNHKAPTTDTDYGFETFNSTGFVTFTGRALFSTEILGLEDTVSQADQAVRALCDKRFGSFSAKPVLNAEDDPFAGLEPRLNLSPDRMQDLLAKLNPDMPREDWVRVGMALHHECNGGSDGLALWDEWSAGGGKYPSSEALQAQWDSFTRRANSGKRPVTMATVIGLVRDNKHPADGFTSPIERIKDVAAKAQVLAADQGTVHTGVHTPEGFGGKYPVVTGGAFSRRDPPNWLIKNVLPKADLIVLFGASGSGKSFVAIDMAAAIAQGLPWRGNRSAKGRVLLIAAEGGGGVAKRLAAYGQHNNIDLDTLDIGVINAAPNFLELDDISELVQSIVAVGGVDMVIVDTFAQVTPGANENAGEDMGKALAHAKSITAATGAVVMMVHHAGKDASKGARGWSGIRAAADAEIEVSRTESGERAVRISKQKDADDGGAWGFKLDVVTLGLDGDGDEITSCVVAEADLPSSDGKVTGSAKGAGTGVKKRGAMESHVVDMLESLPASTVSMPLEAFTVWLVNGIPPPESGKRDVRRQHVQRAVQSLTRGSEPPFVVEHGKVVLL